jgi:hypothetical protein
LGRFRHHQTQRTSPVGEAKFYLAFFEPPRDRLNAFGKKDEFESNEISSDRSRELNHLIVCSKEGGREDEPLVSYLNP